MSTSTAGHQPTAYHTQLTVTASVSFSPHTTLHSVTPASVRMPCQDQQQACHHPDPREELWRPPSTRCQWAVVQEDNVTTAETTWAATSSQRNRSCILETAHHKRFSPVCEGKTRQTDASTRAPPPQSRRDPTHAHKQHTTPVVCVKHETETASNHSITLREHRGTEKPGPAPA